ncbi:MAG: cobalamin-dependent protein [Candidatus Contendobacter sp.]|jgi:trimethylamine corrinoid protein|nr:cobalamin-dependent protein [Gammaproteobacteria bacterium]MCC8993060.1 cobalamin-dependent protein [Candidatus Contendobacter sp.]
MSATLDEFESALLALDRVRVSELLDAVAANQTPLLAVESLIRPALERIGKLWEDNRCALSQVYMSGRICEEMVDVLLGPAATTPRVAPGNARLALAVLDDYHLLGKQIVRAVLRAAGWPVLDYGRQSVAELVARTCADEIDILMISTLMLPSALQVREVTTQLRELSPRTQIVVGGAPFRFDPELWKEVGADAMGMNAAEAVAIVQRLSGGAS